MGAASLWGGVGNGDPTSGGEAPTSALAQADAKVAEIDRLIGRLNAQANEIVAIRAGLLDQYEGTIDQGDLRLMLVEITNQRDETVRKRTELIEARRQVAESVPEYDTGGGLMFGLGALGIVPAMLAGLVALLAAVGAWVAHVWNAIDERGARLAQMRLAENTRRADRGLAPLPAAPGEGGVLAGLSDVVGKAGWVVAAVLLGPPLLRALFGGGRKRRAT